MKCKEIAHCARSERYTWKVGDTGGGVGMEIVPDGTRVPVFPPAFIETNPVLVLGIVLSMRELLRDPSRLTRGCIPSESINKES